MRGDPPHQITVLLQRWRNGDGEAAGELAPLVYQELRRLAASHLRRELGRRTLQPTELAHEVYIRLFRESPLDWEDRSHFFAVAARQMRHLLVDASRRRNSGKRGGEYLRVDLTDRIQAPARNEEEFLAVHQALEVLEGLDPRCTKVLDLRLFGGFTEKDAAEILGISPAAARRDWDFARAWLVDRLRSAKAPGRR